MSHLYERLEARRCGQLVGFGTLSACGTSITVFCFVVLEGVKEKKNLTHTLSLFHDFVYILCFYYYLVPSRMHQRMALATHGMSLLPRNIPPLRRNTRRQKDGRTQGHEQALRLPVFHDLLLHSRRIGGPATHGALYTQGTGTAQGTHL